VLRCLSSRALRNSMHTLGRFVLLGHRPEHPDSGGARQFFPFNSNWIEGSDWILGPAAEYDEVRSTCSNTAIRGEANSFVK
jgi:hypothetical protein